MPFLIWSAVNTAEPGAGLVHADYGSLRRFSYSRDVIAVGGVPNIRRTASTSTRAARDPGACLESGVGPRVRIRLAPPVGPLRNPTSSIRAPRPAPARRISGGL